MKKIFLLLCLASIGNFAFADAKQLTLQDFYNKVFRSEDGKNVIRINDTGVAELTGSLFRKDCENAYIRSFTGPLSLEESSWNPNARIAIFTVSNCALKRIGGGTAKVDGRIGIVFGIDNQVIFIEEIPE
ncbi:MAG: hypothetical protein A2504_06605 [Bdellovibrionales bacterium RIFOXYD12_FULL_39_22]|nr:MAG: hypothetical protein A2385_08925 [Bdellovibrionales bacterium RIFOXYB1_FULL_39_21]OFZ45177.1 MAG: hypothetical protein A2485_05610 [Bdellovibrionales bacterium RIFOXYC12_FULL_39_17]OFZ45631.1 MAG: hypothetical protein A2404_03505 [Bdellovibrionales bacterium RIFOXYC1_FULL_39_130]OFZ74172.1 MAG: hypothetical protein A2451_05875 [Bdellovibrionales bacterium RIFOXYC2_FULL_39_8]OFZ77493.1 MAG: hypothetical protein A2560_09095 [Bdellovibrionales bacterium RIFOXYD1_FULL_39_84]OFZ91622.1 MAG: